MDELRHVFPLAREVYDKSAAVQKFIRATELFARALFVPAVHTNTGAARFSPIPEKKPLSWSKKEKTLGSPVEISSLRDTDENCFLERNI